MREGERIEDMVDVVDINSIPIEEFHAFYSSEGAVGNFNMVRMREREGRYFIDEMYGEA